MVKVKKRSGKIEGYVESKIAAGVKRAGASAEEAANVAKEVSRMVAQKAEITAEELSNMVVASLRKVNKAAADEFTRFRDKKIKAKRPKRSKGRHRVKAKKKK